MHIAHVRFLRVLEDVVECGLIFDLDDLVVEAVLEHDRRAGCGWVDRLRGNIRRGGGRRRGVALRLAWPAGAALLRDGGQSRTFRGCWNGLLGFRLLCLRKEIVVVMLLLEFVLLR